MSEIKKSFNRVINIATKDPVDIHLKFLIIGTYGVGKTSIVNRYTEEKFYPQYRSTIGIDFQRKIIRWSPICTLGVQLWDVAGNEKFRGMTRSYYRNAHGIAVVFDVTKPSTLDAAEVWLNEIRNCISDTDGTSLPVILMGNKNDLHPGLVSSEQIIQFCETNKIEAWCYTSAKLNMNIHKSFEYLIEKALMRVNDNELESGNSIKLHVEKETLKKPETKCCN